MVEFSFLTFLKTLDVNIIMPTGHEVKFDIARNTHKELPIDRRLIDSIKATVW